ncbi:protein maelstrom homolog isoform 3-T3 [Theristicus caerulescens]
MAQRKGSASPYCFFVRDQLPELQRRGLPVTRVGDAVPYCSQAWALLTKEEKMVYTEKARKWNEKRSQKTVKETCNLAHPVPACPTTKMPSVTSLPDASAMSWKSDQAVVAEIFYFLNIYSHGKLPSHCEQRFLPCEIGCVRYSLQNGIMADFHHFIDPEVPPRGFRYHCQAATIGIESHLEILAVEDLVIELYRKKYQKEPSKTWVCRELDVFMWDFSSNTRCKWHEENDILCCALASCKKIAYCISKSLANVYGVSLTAAHLPLQDSDYGESRNTKMVILDAGRFQKMKAESSGCDRHSASPSQDQELVPSNCDSPCGVKTSLYGTSIMRGRGITQLLKSASDLSKSFNN